jgi:hypothetical protein
VGSFHAAGDVASDSWLNEGDLILNKSLRTLRLPLLAMALSLSACAAPGSTGEAAAPAKAVSSSPALTTTVAPALSPSEQFIKDVMTPKDLDLSGLVMPEEVKSAFPDGGAGVPNAMETYIAASLYPELQKGSHITSEADLALFENLRPLMTQAMHKALRTQYMEQQGTSIVPNFTNFDGLGMKTLAAGSVKADDNGTVWQWGNEKAAAKLHTAPTGVNYVEVKIPARFSFNTVNDKGVVSFYASRQYYFVPGPSGEWLLEGVYWSPADQRSSKDSAALLTAKSPIDDM